MNRRSSAPLASVLISLVVFFSSADSAQASTPGWRLMAHDGTFLGSYTCQSIGNRYSPFGSKYSSTSIWNRYGKYGSKYSSLSAFNSYSSNPPAFYNNDEFVSYLSMNKNLPRRTVSPKQLESSLMDECAQDESYREDD